jgi:hypothetical protein
MSLLASTVSRFRARRMRLFFAALGITERTRVLDVGGTPLNWMLAELRPRVTLVNMPIGIERAVPGFQTVSATGCELPLADQSFDVIFSNSVIEHIRTQADRRRFAAETRRVGKGYWVQTPNRWFPVEPHLCTPFLHFLPRGWQGWIVRRWTVWDLLERPSLDRREYYIEHYLKDVRLLSASELADLFPEARIVRERFLGATKSLIAVHAE